MSHIHRMMFLSLYSLGLLSIWASESPRPVRSMLEDDPCLDAKKIQDSAHHLEFSSRHSKHLNKPWQRTDTSVKIYSSPGFSYQWTWLKNLNIRGVSPITTIDDLLRFLDNQNCSFLPTGQVVRQLVLRHKPVQLSGEVSCDINQLYNACYAKFGAAACGLFPVEQGGYGANRLEIGDARTNSSIDEVRAEPVLLYQWNSTLGRQTNDWAYSIDHLTVFDNQAGSIYLIDMTGRGYRDVCDKRIVPAVNEKQWKDWAETDTIKLYNYYELRSQGFSAGDTALPEFINKMIKDKHNKKAAQSFYCESVLNGVMSWAGEELTTACHVTYPDSTLRDKITAARANMQSEMGHLWTTEVGPAIDEMEAIYLTERQFVDVRDKLKHRISPPTSTRPTLSLGEPLVNDISEVHRRPILSKMEDVHELPKDFPTANVIQPDGKMSFKEQDHPAGGGYNDAFAYQHNDGENPDEEKAEGYEDRDDEDDEDDEVADHDAEGHPSGQRNNRVRGAEPMMENPGFLVNFSLAFFSLQIILAFFHC